MRGPELAGPVASPLDGGFGRARIPEDSGSTTRLGGGGWRGGGSCVLRSSSVALRYGSGEKKPALVFFTVRAELNPQERPREPPGAHPAPGGRVHFATHTGPLVIVNGQVYFSLGVSALRYGRATPFRDGGGRDVNCPW